MNNARQDPSLQQSQPPQTPTFNPGLPGSRRMTAFSNANQPSGPFASGGSSVGMGMMTGGSSVMGSANSRWSMSSGYRQSISGGQRNSVLNSSVMMSQRPSPMAPLAAEDYGTLGGSMMGPPMSSNRRVSGFAPRQSIGGGSGGIAISSNSVSLRDPRPVKDKSYQRTLIHNLLNFLTQVGYPHPITVKTLTQPTNKDFQDIFKFLYLRLEPGYDFQKKFEDEVPVLLKAMKYPSADTISKTSLYTVGTPHSWPYMLALLGWMMEVILVIDRHEEWKEEQQMSNAHNRDRDIDPKMDMTQVPPDKALYHYLTRTYRIWMLTGNVQDPEVEENMAKSFERRKEYAESEIKHQRELNDSLRQELEELQVVESPVIALEKEQKSLKQEIDQLKKAIDVATPRIASLTKANEESTDNIANKEVKLTDLERAKREVQEIVRTQTVTRAGLESKLDERNRLRRREENLKQQCTNNENELRTLEKRFVDGENEAEKLVREFNALAVKIGIVPISAKYAAGQDYELRLDLDKAVSGTGKVYSLDVKTRTEKTISGLRNQFTRDFNTSSDEYVSLKQELEILEDSIEEGTEKLRIKEYQLSQLNKKYHEEKEATRADLMNRQGFTETREEQIQSQIQETNQNMAEAERLEQDNQMMERQAAQNRELCNRRIREMLQQLSEVKQHVEQQIGVVQNMASKELEDTQRQMKRLQEILEMEAQFEQRSMSSQDQDPDHENLRPKRDLLFSST
ncbi:kinetochore-associated Ndc80 complex subunit ndc80 [Lunasporangiospora selenospora]|uniref:Kinetochore protein NDC80 n=1 Tax=Lunasporangiospora selenospora TaxID=979761 RepID=A0A9P6G431_9FUNG|nr:kinetochore-associated Ndc80 complex subunit ndc80 [Lunasporangiospora selenospora]